MIKTVGYAALTIAMLFIGISVGNDLVSMLMPKPTPKS